MKYHTYILQYFYHDGIIVELSGQYRLRSKLCMTKNDDRYNLKALVSISSIAICVALCVAIGLGIGYMLDKYFNTHPIITFVFTIIGLAAGIYEAARTLIKTISDDK